MASALDESEGMDARLSIEFTQNVEILETVSIDGFFQGWSVVPSEDIFRGMLKTAEYVWLAIDDECSKLIGFVYAHSDGYLSAYIPLLEVLPDYRSRKIGSRLLRRILKDLSQFYMVDLTCDDQTLPFYDSFKFAHANGLMIRRSSNI